jgi:hypothetical protein
MNPWIALPQDVLAFVSAAFATANEEATKRLINVPNVREGSLDDAFVEAFVPNSAPTVLPSGTTIKMDIHNVGGLRRAGSWETADIGVIVYVFRREYLICRKIGLLQSKRLYPKNNDVDDKDPVDFFYGMNAFLKRGEKSPLGTLHRTYDFDEQCVYGEIKAESDQINFISDFNKRFGTAVYYMLYNPPDLPCSVQYPVMARQSVSSPKIGCRIHSAADIHAAVTSLRKGAAPSYAMVGASTNSDWRVEHWASELLACKVGRQFDQTDDEMLERLVVRRTGPIGAAILISIALPGD